MNIENHEGTRCPAPAETVKDRLLRFLKAERVSQAEFCRRMGLSVAYLAGMRKSLPEEKVIRLTELFPRLNRDWLMYGEGEMYRPASTSSRGDDAGDYLVPLLPVSAYAGSLRAYSESVDRKQCEQIMSPVKNADMAIVISGDSMEPQFRSGNIAVIRRINENAFIPWGHPLIIDTENGVLIKVVLPADRGDCLTAHSLNPHYPDILVPKKSVYGMYRIVAVLDRVTTM